MKSLTLIVLIAFLAAAPAQAAALKVAVLPFDVLGEAGHEWVGRALQEALGTGVQNMRGVTAILAPAVSPTDANFALNTARSAGADFIIFGTVQFVDDRMRVNGHVLSVASGQSVGSLTSDSNLRDLFTVEDSLAHRAGLLITPPATSPPVATAPRPQIQLVGPALPPQQSRYFDGDLSGVTTTPDRFRSEYDRYYYHPISGDPSAGWCGYFGLGGFGGYGWGSAVMQTSVGAIGTW
jgi:TolB-like protein